MQVTCFYMKLLIKCWSEVRFLSVSARLASLPDQSKVRVENTAVSPSVHTVFCTVSTAVVWLGSQWQWMTQTGCVVHVDLWPLWLITDHTHTSIYTAFSLCSLCRLLLHPLFKQKWTYLGFHWLVFLFMFTLVLLYETWSRVINRIEFVHE